MHEVVNRHVVSEDLARATFNCLYQWTARCADERSLSSSGTPMSKTVRPSESYVAALQSRSDFG